ncbi:hypothetical protein [Hyalangium minutum]|uniref:hypothetical protein n=1 Tax=Hyalangium minutum TaxID=394096 RepID=UPI0005C5E612|nr:hypothetical protein [Hyalangium minutum]
MTWPKGRVKNDSASSPLHPALLPLGTQVGPWRVVDWAGRGVSREECDAWLTGHMYQGACYVPIFAPDAQRPNTSGAKPPR